MRLADVDALKTELMLASERLTVAYEAHGECHVVHSEDIIKCDKMNELLRNFPTIDAVPVKRGKWLERDVSEIGNAIDQWQSAKCSYCGRYLTTPYMYYFTEYNYCPHCGARMDDGGEDDA